MLKIINGRVGEPFSFPLDPTILFRPGMVGQLKKLDSGKVGITLSDGTAPFGIIDDIKEGFEGEENTTLRSGKITIWSNHNMIMKTDQYNKTDPYRINCALYVGKDGILGSSPHMYDQPSVGICMGEPSQEDPLLQFIWRGGFDGISVATLIEPQEVKEKEQDIISALEEVSKELEANKNNSILPTPNVDPNALLFADHDVGASWKIMKDADRIRGISTDTLYFDDHQDFSFLTIDGDNQNAMMTVDAAAPNGIIFNKIPINEDPNITRIKIEDPSYVPTKNGIEKLRELLGYNGMEPGHQIDPEEPTNWLAIGGAILAAAICGIKTDQNKQSKQMEQHKELNEIRA